MAKRRYGIDEEKIARFLKEGRGEGHRKDYKPWIVIQDVSSLGRSTRIYSFKTGREHHLLSDLETSSLLLFDWADQVLDIREQFPLDRDITLRIAIEMGVKHPMDVYSQPDIVMTTDFLLDVGSNNKLVARAVKPAKQLENKRVLEKLEIERRYWEFKGVDWGIITDQDLPKHRIKNLHWLHEMQSLDNMVVPHPDYWQDRCNSFLSCFSQASTMTIKQFLKHLENTQGFSVGEGVTVLRHLAANKVISFDLDTEFKMSASINVISSTPFVETQSKRMVG